MILNDSRQKKYTQYGQISLELISTSVVLGLYGQESHMRICWVFLEYGRVDGEIHCRRPSLVARLMSMVCVCVLYGWSTEYMPIFTLLPLS